MAFMHVSQYFAIRVNGWSGIAEKPTCKAKLRTCSALTDGFHPSQQQVQNLPGHPCSPGAGPVDPARPDQPAPARLPCGSATMGSGHAGRGVAAQTGRAARLVLRVERGRARGAAGAQSWSRLCPPDRSSSVCWGDPQGLWERSPQSSGGTGSPEVRGWATLMPLKL